LGTPHGQLARIPESTKAPEAKRRSSGPTVGGTLDEGARERKKKKMTSNCLLDGGPRNRGPIAFVPAGPAVKHRTRISRRKRPLAAAVLTASGRMSTEACEKGKRTTVPPEPTKTAFDVVRGAYIEKKQKT